MSTILPIIGYFNVMYRYIYSEMSTILSYIAAQHLYPTEVTM